MKTIAMLLLSMLAFSTSADESVNGYYRRDGTYVQPHMRSSPNQYRYDNFSSQGNSNPYTGQHGSGQHEYTNPPAYNGVYNNPSTSRRQRW